MAREQSAATPLNDALNKPKTKLGLDYRLAGLCVGIGVCAALFLNLLFGIALAILLPAAIRFSLRKDPQLYRLWCLSFLQRAHYDPGKARRAR